MIKNVILLILLCVISINAEVKTLWKAAVEGDQIDVPEYVNYKFLENKKILALGHVKTVDDKKLIFGRDKEYFHFTVVDYKFFKTKFSSKFNEAFIYVFMSEIDEKKEVFKGKLQDAIEIKKKDEGLYDVTLFNSKGQKLPMVVKKEEVEKLFNIFKFNVKYFNVSIFEASWREWERNKKVFTAYLRDSEK